MHLAALPDGDNGCYISPKMLKSPLFRFLLWKHGLSPDNPREANQKYLDDLLTELRASRHVRQAVLLGMDGVYDQNGQLAKEETFLISNDYVLKTAEHIRMNSSPASPSILSGATRSTKSIAAPMRSGACEGAAERATVQSRPMPNTERFTAPSRNGGCRF